LPIIKESNRDIKHAQINNRRTSINKM